LKRFVLDTNVLLHDPKALQVFEDNEVIIPLSVLDELDNAKSRPDELGRNARTVVKILDKLRSIGSLSRGVKLNESMIRVELNHQDNVPDGLESEKKDNRIISTALGLKKDGERVIIVSKDINLRVKCDALNIEVQDYVKDKIATNLESVYSGVLVQFVESQEIDSIYSNNYIEVSTDGLLNQFTILKSNSNNKQSAIARYVEKNRIKLCKFPEEIYGIYPRNAEQKMAVDLLLNRDIKLVTLIGKAGSGKTLLASAAALKLVFDNSSSFQRVLISRPIQPIGRDLGFLPGDLDEKLKPWMQPIYDNLELILGYDYQELGEFKYSGLIQVEPLTYIRGRSIPKSIIILDEAQNLTAQEIKTVITRIGEDSKIIITGDIEQIDNPYVDFADNGLTHVIEKFKNYSIAGHITLRKGERSELATVASEIL
jgi:PhoH-like ATPase